MDDSQKFTLSYWTQEYGVWVKVIKEIDSGVEVLFPNDVNIAQVSIEVPHIPKKKVKHKAQWKQNPLERIKR